MPDSYNLESDISPDQAGMRLDRVLAELFPQFSRARLQSWVKGGQILVDARQWRPRDKVLGGEHVTLQATVGTKETWEAEAIPLAIVHEDDELLVINKPAGLVVHPAAGNWQGTLLNALINHDPRLADLPRGGIVHRLDKDTSGLMVVARNLAAHKSLVDQLQARSVSREYLAAVNGAMTAGGTVDEPLGRHPVQRTRMAVVRGNNGKPAVSHYRVEQRFPFHTLVRVSLETGRTHQIRVHMAHIRHPIIGDPVYGGRLIIPKGCSEGLRQVLRGFRRQALHATRLSLVHPQGGETMSWEAPLPDDMQQLLMQLDEDARLRQAGDEG